MDNIANSLLAVQESVAKYLDGDTSSHAHMLASIKSLQIAAEGPANYAAELRFHVSLVLLGFHTTISGDQILL